MSLISQPGHVFTRERPSQLMLWLGAHDVESNAVRSAYPSICVRSVPELIRHQTRQLAMVVDQDVGLKASYSAQFERERFFFVMLVFTLNQNCYHG